MAYVMSANSSEKSVTRRNWISFGSVLTVQTQNAFNDNLVKFVVIGLALAVARDTAIGSNIQFIMSALLPIPFVLLAPVAGYYADHFSKRTVIYACLIAQMLLFMGIAAAVWFHNLPAAIVGFFLLSVQSTFFSPAKQGILKELVGSPRLAFVNGLMQMFTMLGILGGIWLGGMWFDTVLGNSGDPWRAALIPIGVIGLAALTPLIIGLFIEHSPPHKTVPFTPSIFVRHFIHLRQLFGQRSLRLAAVGISFYWFVAYFLGLVVVSFGLELHPDTAKGGATSASSGMSALIGIGLMIGSSAVSVLSRKRIELGMVPIGGLGLTLGLLGLGLCPVGGKLFYLSLSTIGFASGFFLVPLVAFLQDEAEDKYRGRVLSATALLTSLAGFLAIATGKSLQMLGLSASAQVLLFVLPMLVVTLFILKLQPQHSLRFTLLLILRTIYKIDSRNLDRIPKTGGMLLVANHVSYIDWLILSAACPRPVRFIFDQRYAKTPLFGSFLRLFCAIPVSRSSVRDMIRKASTAIHEGDIVCIFPEGQLSRTGILNELKKGFYLIATKADTPVLPVYVDSLWGSIFSFERNRYFWKWPLNLRHRIVVNFGEPIPHHEATPKTARMALQALSADSLGARPELQTTLDIALVRSLKRHPGARLMVEQSKRRHQFKRGQCLALGIALSRHWKRHLPAGSEKVALFLPPGSTPIYINLALLLAGKIPVNLPFNPKPNLDLLSARLDEHGITTIITSRAFFPQLEGLTRSLDPPYQLLDMRGEINAAGQVRIMMERILVRFESTRSLLRRLELNQPITPGEQNRYHDKAFGFVPEPRADSPSTLPPTVFLSHHNILANVRQFRSVNLLAPREIIFSEAALNTASGVLFSLFLPAFAHTTAVMRSFGNQSDATLIETMLREDSVSTIALNPDLCGQILSASPWHPSLKEQVRQLLDFFPPETTPGTELSEQTGSPVLRGYSPETLGTIITASMIDPPLASAMSPEQHGHLPDSLGRLMPGIAIRQNDQGLEIQSPSLPGEPLAWHPLPDGSRIDDEGFVFLD